MNPTSQYPAYSIKKDKTLLIDSIKFNKTLLIDYLTYHSIWLSKILFLFFLVDTNLVTLVKGKFAFQLLTSIDFSIVCAKALN